MDKAIYFWVNSTALDKAQTESRRGDLLFRQNLYVEATEKYIEAYKMLIEAADEINRDINTARNGVYFIIIISLFGYVIYALFDSSLSLNEYKNRYKVYFKKK